MAEKPLCQACAEKASRTATNKARKMNCAQLASKIQELIDTEKKGRSGTKGLVQRLRDFLGDDWNHRQQYLDQQRSLQAYMNEFQSKNCGPPPSGALEWVLKPLPSTMPQGAPNSNIQKAVSVGVGAGALYVTYRVLRMLPSLAAPITIPLNLAIP